MQPKENRLLSELTDESYQRLRPHMRFTLMPLGQQLKASNESPSVVYFPATSTISLVNSTLNGGCTEIAVIGREGIFDVSLFLGGMGSTASAIVQRDGYGYRVPTKVAQQEFERRSDFYELVLKFTMALGTQVQQAAVCNRHHSVEQQVCRWLLMALDRSSGDEIRITQDFIARMLGVRRESISMTLKGLRERGLIHLARGAIRIYSRANLQTYACECYEFVRAQYSRVLPQQVPPFQPARPSVVRRERVEAG